MNQDAGRIGKARHQPPDAMQEMFRRRRLPHWDPSGATYFITARLEGSIPAQGLLQIREVHDRTIALRPHDRSREWQTLVWKKTFVEQERWLDCVPASQYLKRPDLAEVVANSLCHFHGTRYELQAFVVMPSHFHWLFRPLPEWAVTLPEGKSAREVIMHSIKSYTAHECNLLLGRTGLFWQDESFDHCVRDEAELERIVSYIEMNPVQAGLCQHPEEWRFSSAYGRLIA